MEDVPVRCVRQDVSRRAKLKQTAAGVISQTRPFGPGQRQPLRWRTFWASGGAVPHWSRAPRAARRHIVLALSDTFPPDYQTQSPALFINPQDRRGFLWNDGRHG